MFDASGDALEKAIRNLAERSMDDVPKEVSVEFRSLPVVLRAALGAVALAAAGRPLNGVTLAAAAGFSRGTAYRHNREAVNLLIEFAPALVDSMLNRVGEGSSLTILNANLRQRDETIAELRERLHSSEKEREMALAYARDLFETVSSEIRDIAAEKAQKVRVLRVVEPPSEDSPS
ncbi:MAG: hypothetical protein HKL87_02520 [Acidimicrobiaceae bacterium]|nr:hypothetical protein [Acidimicrobiaceae bacterium]